MRSQQRRDGPPLAREGHEAFPAHAHQHDNVIIRTTRRNCLRLAFCTLLWLPVPSDLLAAPSWKVQQGFQGIPWGASADAIESKFGEVAELSDESCNDNLSRIALEEQNHDCSVVKVDQYFLDGVPFSASFRFDRRSKGLAAVVLTSSLKSKNLTPKGVRKVQAECQQMYERFSRQLAGAFPSSILPHQLFDRPSEPFTRANYRAWEAGETTVRLRWSYGYTDHWKRWRRADGCELEISYAVLPPEEEVVPESGAW